MYEPLSLTEVEMLGLSSQFNFADGHAYHDLSMSQRSIVQRLEDIWRENLAVKINDAGDLYFEAFWRLAECPSLKAHKHFRICPTASNSIDIAAACLAEKGERVGLLHPTFDNLYLLLKRRGVKVAPIEETALFESVETTLGAVDAGAVFLVNPNNPTGQNLSRSQFREVVEFCARANKILILDNTFRFFVDHGFDQYQMLIDSGVSFIGIEDTGKVWPTQDMKASLMIYSPDLAKTLEIIYEEIYLCVSNFTLGILREFLVDAKVRGLKSAVWDEVESRRKFVREAIAATALSPAQVALPSQLSVEWLEVHAPFANDLDAMYHFQKQDLTLLPGRKFFWADTANSNHQRFVRLSLLKPQRHFFAAVYALQKGLHEFTEGEALWGL